jgi:hypothetical protein
MPTLVKNKNMDWEIIPKSLPGNRTDCSVILHEPADDPYTQYERVKKLPGHTSVGIDTYLIAQLSLSDT